MSKRALLYLFIAAGVGATGAALFLFVYMRPLPVEIVRPSQNVPIKVFGLGTVEARILSRIGFEAGGALVELHADQGDRVEDGVILARLYSAEQEARVAKAAAGVTNAEAALRMTAASVGKARAILAQRESINQRRQKLVANRTTSVEVADEAKMEKDVAAAELIVAMSNVDVAKAALEDAKAQYEFESVLLDQHVLRAPYDAIVVARQKEKGTVLVAGEPLFTLVRPETVWALAYVDEARAGSIRVGQPAEVRLRSLPRLMLQGHVARIDIESDRVSEERRVYIACDQCPEQFHLGEQAEVFITAATVDKALLIPETAVTGFDGARGIIWIVENGRLRRQRVEFGHRTLDSQLEIIEGVPSSAFVVKGLRPGLREGRAASIVKPASQ